MLCPLHATPGDGAAKFKIAYKDLAGNEAAAELTEEGITALMVDQTKPTLKANSVVSITSSNDKPQLATKEEDDTVTIKFELSEEIQTPICEDVKTGSKAVAASRLTVAEDGGTTKKKWKCTYAVLAADGKSPPRPIDLTTNCVPT